MACEICNRTSCTRSFHSLSEQDEFDTKTGRYALEEECPKCKGSGNVGDNINCHIGCCMCGGTGHV